MINTNAALYIGIVTACVLECAPDASVRTERNEKITMPPGYRIVGMRKVGSGSDARSVVAEHMFLDAEVRDASAQHLGDSARIAGDSIGAQLARAT